VGGVREFVVRAAAARETPFWEAEGFRNRGGRRRRGGQGGRNKLKLDPLRGN